MPEPTPIGPRIRERRYEIEMFQSELAEKSGVKLETVKNIELERTRFPRCDAAYKIAKTLGVSVEWLLTGE